jgi:hypothetical protein
MTADATMTTEAISARTALTIRKWDAEQTEWVLRRERGDAAVGRLRRGENATVRPEAFGRHHVEPYETWHHGNCNNVLQAGWVALLGGVAGTTMTNKFSASYGRIGAGTSSTAVSYSQTALVGDTGSGSTTSYYMLVSAAPVIATGSTPPTLALTAAFGTAVGNFAWNEFGTDNYTASGVTTTGLGAGYIFFNRGVPAGGMGVKSSGQTWTATESISFGFPSGSGTVS